MVLKLLRKSEGLCQRLGGLKPISSMSGVTESGTSLKGTPLKSHYFIVIDSSSMKTVTNRCRVAAYRNKHC